MSDINNYIPSVFKENKLGKNGFVYRGSRAFGKVVVGLKELMKKGYQSDINGIDVKVIDSRTNGNGHEIEVKGRDIEELQFLNCTDQAKRKIRML